MPTRVDVSLGHNAVTHYYERKRKVGQPPTTEMDRCITTLPKAIGESVTCGCGALTFVVVEGKGPGPAPAVRLADLNETDRKSIVDEVVRLMKAQAEPALEQKADHVR